MLKTEQEMTQHAQKLYQPVAKILLLCHSLCARSHSQPRIISSANRIAIMAVLTQDAACDTISVHGNSFTTRYTRSSYTECDPLWKDRQEVGVLIDWSIPKLPTYCLDLNTELTPYNCFYHWYVLANTALSYNTYTLSSQSEADAPKTNKNLIFWWAVAARHTHTHMPSFITFIDNNTLISICLFMSHFHYEPGRHSCCSD